MDRSNVTTSSTHQFQSVLGCNTKVGVLSCHQLHIFEIVNYVTLSGFIAVFGLVANVINIVVFFRQGFTNTVNISFFSMAISDLCCLVALLWVVMCLNPFIIQLPIPFDPDDFMYLPGAWPHVICGRITSYITVFITAERCLSIITPLKVKQMITPKRTTIIICVIYVVNVATFLPELCTSYLAYTFVPERNATLIAIVFTSGRSAIVGLVYILSSILGMSSFVGVIVWTVLLVVKLQQSSRWRAMASNDHHGNISTRDKKTIKMVAMIASILIVCYTPGSIIGMATFLEKGLTLRGNYRNVAVASWSFAYVFQSFNSSVNIFLYYSMSTNYRQTFEELFGKTAKPMPTSASGKKS